MLAQNPVFIFSGVGKMGSAENFNNGAQQRRGETTVAIALLSALKKRVLSPAAFNGGPV